MSAPLNFSTINLSAIDAATLINHLYSIFTRDFVSAATLLNGTIWIDPQCGRKTDGKEASFWHLTTRMEEVNGEKERYTDFRRAERLEWIKLIIENHNAAEVHHFYHEESKSKSVRLYLWAHAHDFVVILQKLGKSSSFLVTSFYVDQQHKRTDFAARLKNYRENKNPALAGCEWF